MISQKLLKLWAKISLYHDQTDFFRCFVTGMENSHTDNTNDMEASALSGWGVGNLIVGQSLMMSMFFDRAETVLLEIHPNDRDEQKYKNCM